MDSRKRLGVLKRATYFLTSLPLIVQVYIFFSRTWVGSVTALMCRIQQEWCYASFQNQALRNWQLPLSVSWNIHSGGNQHPVRSLPMQRPPCCEEAQVSHVGKEIAILAKPAQASNMPLKKPFWKFQPQQMWHGEKLRKPAKNQTWGPNLWPHLSHPSHLQPFKLKPHSTVKQR